MPQHDIHRFQLRQIKLAYLRLIRKQQRLIQLPSVQICLARRSLFQNPLRQHSVKISNPNSLAVQLLQKSLGVVWPERLLNRSLQRRKFPRLLDLDRRLFERHARQSLERETGIEPATNSLEGCDSTTELLPLSLSGESRFRI